MKPRTKQTLNLNLNLKSKANVAGGPRRAAHPQPRNLGECFKFRVQGGFRVYGLGFRV